MFQDFSATSDSVSDNSRLTAVRNLMEEQSIDFLIVPHADEQRNEYQPACSRRLAWLSGFTGSAGAAIISADRAVLFVDGRYTLQAANQVGTAEWEIDSLVDNSLVEVGDTRASISLSEGGAVYTTYDGESAPQRWSPRRTRRGPELCSHDQQR